MFKNKSTPQMSKREINALANMSGADLIKYTKNPTKWARFKAMAKKHLEAIARIVQDQ